MYYLWCIKTGNKKTKNMGTKINNLKSGQSVVISSCNGITCLVERSANTLRFVRTFTNGSFEIFKTCSI